MSDSGWIGVDFDGTLAHYDKWIGIDHVGAPIKLMCDRVRQWLAEGKEVKIFTARVYGAKDDYLIEVCTPMWKFCEREFGRKLDITNVKDFRMIELWDDRAVGVVPNTGMIV